MISILIPANNEEQYLGLCLESLLSQETDRQVEVIIAANACTDRTVSIAHSYAGQFKARGWAFDVLDLKEGGKPNALNRADAAATWEDRIYLDADVILSPPLLEQLAVVLNRADPIYASGKLIVSPAQNWMTRAYGRIWSRLPFMTEGVPGAGLFAVNASGRRRWTRFPSIISDDTFVRLQFTPQERVGVPASYLWPLIEGFGGLVRVRRRQDAGVQEVARLYPDLMANEGKNQLTPAHLLRLVAHDPVGFAVYAAVSLAVRTRRDNSWTRGR